MKNLSPNRARIVKFWIDGLVLGNVTGYFIYLVMHMQFPFWAFAWLPNAAFILVGALAFAKTSDSTPRPSDD